MKTSKIIAVAIMLTSLVFTSGCGTMGTGDGDKTWKSSAIGTAAGAALGAAVGAATGGDWKKGLAIGAAAGLAVGATTGILLDRQEEKLRQAGIRTKRDKDGRLLVSLAGDTLRFSSNSSKLNSAGRASLQKIANIIKEYPENRLAIQGHTDSTGGADGNLKLSDSRALAVQNAFRAYGVPARCIVEAKGYGEQFPIADNNTSIGREANRRVELVISADEAEAKKNQAEREKYKKG